MDATQAYRGIAGATLSVVHDQELVWANGYGYAHVERDEPATPSTMYSMCSISKLFTAVGVLQLRNQGRVELNDPVAQHLDWFQSRTTTRKRARLPSKGSLPTPQVSRAKRAPLISARSGSVATSGMRRIGASRRWSSTSTSWA